MRRTDLGDGGMEERLAHNFGSNCARSTGDDDFSHLES